MWKFYLCWWKASELTTPAGTCLTERAAPLPISTTPSKWLGCMSSCWAPIPTTAPTLLNTNGFRLLRLSPSQSSMQENRQQNHVERKFGWVFCIQEVLIHPNCLSGRQADLEKVDRSRTPWLVAMLHAPWYNSNSFHQGDGDKMMAAMEPLLYQNNVDIMFAGHIHAYERSVLN